MNEYIAAILLGIVEGLTEFLPVSSTGHLVVFGHGIGFTGPKAEFFEIFIQFGAILAVVVLYWRRFLEVFDFRSAKFSANLAGIAGIKRFAVACLPIFVLGALYGSKIKALLFAPVPVACALIFGAFFMLWIESKPRITAVESLDQLTIQQALQVGIFQCLALWPGMSRSASTMIGGMLAGVSRKTAAEFSFLVAVPVITVAALHDAWENASLLSANDIGVFAVGSIVSFITAIAAIKFFIALLGHYTLRPFAYYRLALGTLVLLLHYFS